MIKKLFVIYVRGLFADLDIGVSDVTDEGDDTLVFHLIDQPIAAIKVHGWHNTDPEELAEQLPKFLKEHQWPTAPPQVRAHRS